MKYLKIGILFILVGCNSISVENATKTLVKKGNQKGNDYVSYSFLLNAEEEFTIDNVAISGKTQKLNYYYKDLNTGLSSYEMLKPFPKGNYSFHFKQLDLHSFSENEFLVIQYAIKEEKFSKKIKIDKKETSISLR